MFLSQFESASIILHSMLTETSSFASGKSAARHLSSAARPPSAPESSLATLVTVPPPVSAVSAVVLSHKYGMLWDDATRRVHTPRRRALSAPTDSASICPTSTTATMNKMARKTRGSRCSPFPPAYRLLPPSLSPPHLRTTISISPALSAPPSGSNGTLRIRLGVSTLRNRTSLVAS
ncbi:hypothetical protein EVG20_g10818 [Dentipellis fragilis]|uniref:Uncharacterized protein n=1 Tax=Dentipellis fragilis TaxID=205917 RepID=A0A4Y9XNY3_9AGAM|nr:hypothetical protein EVG20_g10818 [Dentipellis fragilis]